METATKKLSPMFVLVLMILSMISGAMALNKVGPILPIISHDLAIATEAQAGLLITVFVFSGIFLALPIGMIITRYGAYKTGLVALLATVIGSVIGAMPIGYALMLVSRIIQGVGLVCLATIGPTIVSTSFTEKNRSAAMGFLICYMAFGQTAMLLLAPRIAEAGPWRNLWWLTAAYTAVMLIVWAVCLKPLDSRASAASIDEQRAAAKAALSQVFRNKGVWLAGIVMMLFLIPQQAVIFFLPSFLYNVRGVDMVTGSAITSVAPIVGIPVGILTGVVADKVGSRRIPIAVLMFACAAVYAAMPFWPTNTYVVMVVLYGIATMGVVALCFSIMADVLDAPAHGGIAAGLLNVFLWLGSFLSSIVFGFFVDMISWNAAFFVGIPIAAVGGILAFMIKKGSGLPAPQALAN